MLDTLEGVVAAHGVPSGWPDEPVLYAGGVFGAVFVLSSVLLVRRSGVLIAALGIALVADRIGH